MRIRGKIANVVYKKAYCFVRGEDGEDYFAHISDFTEPETLKQMLADAKWQWETVCIALGMEQKNVIEFLPSTGRTHPRAVAIKVLP